MEFNWPDFWMLIGPIEVLAALLIGLQIGLTYAWSQRLGTSAFHSVVVTAPFFLTLAIVRGTISGSETWERWLSASILYVLYCLGMSLGTGIRRRWEIRRRGASLTDREHRSISGR